MKNLPLSIGSSKKVANRGQGITKANIQSIAESLSKTELKVIVGVFIDHSKVNGISKKTIDSLCSKGIIRHDTDLLTNKPIIVLNPGGKRLCDFIKRGNKPKSIPEITITVRVDLEPHLFVRRMEDPEMVLGCARCNKPPDHKIHLPEGMLLCAGLSQDVRTCFNEVKINGSVCPSCSTKLWLWREAELVLQSPKCPCCGGLKRVGFSIDQKCYHRLSDPLKHGLFKQHGEPVYAYRVRYPGALAAALDFLNNLPTQAEINERAKIITIK